MPPHARRKDVPPHGSPRSRNGGARRHHDEAVRSGLTERPYSEAGFNFVVIFVGLHGIIFVKPCIT
jgi:hypothetical protein